MQYIESKVRYEKVADDGTAKKVTETYLVDAESFTEAEARVTEQMRPRLNGDFSVEAVKKSKIAEIFADPSAEKFWLVKWYVTEYKDDGSEKRVNHLSLVQADSLEHAVKSFGQSMRSTVNDYELGCVQETPILEVFSTLRAR